MPVICEHRNKTVVLTINRPEALNALNHAVIERLGELIDGISSEQTECLIITGAGQKSFVAGADISEMCEMGPEAAKIMTETGQALMSRIESLKIPVIAAVNGYALGGGCELAMACDIRIAAENALFGQPEVALGITAGYGGTQRLPRLVGMGAAKELLFTGRNIKADEALRIGLVNSVHPQPRLMEEAMLLVDRITKNKPGAVRATKRAVNRGRDVAIEKALTIESEECSACFGTPDQIAAMRAFLQRNER